MSDETRRAEGPTTGPQRALDAAEAAEKKRREEVLKQHRERTGTRPAPKPKKAPPKTGRDSGEED